MQVYRDLEILTARPSPAETAAAPHRLFGEIDGAENYSVGRWVARAGEILAATSGLLLFVGGTGLYFRALTQGLSEIPSVPEEVRARVRADAEGLETPKLHARLAAIDPAAAPRLRPSDRQRVLRALEVFAATGRSLTGFQSRREPPALPEGDWRGLFLAPDREALKRAISGRFAAMLERGALAEVQALAARGLDPALPVMRAHGAPHLMAHLRGELSLETAAALSVRDTHAYAKRQFTWARHQAPDFVWTAPEDAEANAVERLQSP